MSRTILNRLCKLEGTRQTGKPVVIFLWDETDGRWPEQQAEIERMKQAGRCLILLTEGNGGEAWEGERMVFSV